MLPVREPCRAVPRLRDPVRGDGVRGKELGGALGIACGVLELLEDSRHLPGVESGVGQQADPDPVRLHLVLAREVDPSLRGRADHRGGRRLAGLHVLGADHDGREDPRQHRQVGAAGVLERPRDVALGDVRDLVRKDGRELALGARRQYESRVDADEAARRREGVQRSVLDHEEREPEVLAIGRCDEPVPERLDVLLYLGIADQGEPRSDFAHERLPERALLGGRERLLGHVAEIGKLHLRTRPTGRTHRAADDRQQHEARSKPRRTAACMAGGASFPAEIRPVFAHRHEFLRPMDTPYTVDRSGRTGLGPEPAS